MTEKDFNDFTVELHEEEQKQLQSSPSSNDSSDHER